MRAAAYDRILMIRAASGRKKDLYEITRLVDVGRQPAPGGIGPDRAATMVPFLQAHFSGDGVSWLLYARFKGESWIHCLASSGFFPAERLASNGDLQVVTVAFDKRENRMHARLYKKGTLVAELVAAGKDEAPLEIVSFKSSVHPKTFPKRCKTVREAVESFCAAVDGRLRDLTASTARGGLELQDSQGRVVGVNELDELEVSCYTP